MTNLATPLADYAQLAAPRVPSTAGTTDLAKAREAAENFEAFYLSQAFEQMFQDVEPDSMFGGGQGEKVFRSLLFQEYGKQAAKTGGVGIADMVQKEILRMQEAQKP